MEKRSEGKIITFFSAITQSQAEFGANFALTHVPFQWNLQFGHVIKRGIKSNSFYLTFNFTNIYHKRQDEFFFLGLQRAGVA